MSKESLLIIFRNLLTVNLKSKNNYNMQELKSRMNSIRNSKIMNLILSKLKNRQKRLSLWKRN